MSMIIDGTSGATFPDSSAQATSAIVGGKVPYTNLPAGSVLQVVNATQTTQNTTTSTSFVATGLTATITPKLASSKILVMYSAQITNTSNSSIVAHNIYRNSTPLINGTTGNNVYNMEAGTGNYVWTYCNFQYLDSPSTTSATTYTIYQKTNTGTAYFIWGNGSLGTITLMEIAA